MVVLLVLFHLNGMFIAFQVKKHPNIDAFFQYIYSYNEILNKVTVFLSYFNLLKVKKFIMNKIMVTASLMNMNNSHMLNFFR